MQKREIIPGVSWVGAVDWHRQHFDELVPLPQGTSYNAYLVEGRDKTVLLDAVDPAMAPVLMERLAGVERLDFVIAHHAEQDHSGAIPAVLERYPQAKVLASPKCVNMLQDHLGIPAARLQAVADGDTLDLGGRSLRFMHMPWVHWPETMVSLLEPDQVLFSCDFFASHLATSDLVAVDEAAVHEAARMYYAQIMMPYAKQIRGHLERLAPLDVRLIAPSHGPVHVRPAPIVEAHRRWVSGGLANRVLLPTLSMHGSTARLSDRLLEALVDNGVGVRPFDLLHLKLDQFAAALVDAATLVFAAPAVLGGPHPLAGFAATIADALRPPLRFAGYIGSYGWARSQLGKTAEMLPHLKPEFLEPVLCQGLPKPEDLAAIDRLAVTIADRHRSLEASA